MKQLMISLSVLAMSFVSSNSVTAQNFQVSWTGQPDTYDLRMQNAQIDGYGPWQFGMTPGQVQQHILNILPGADIRDEIDPVQGVQTLSVDTDTLPLLTTDGASNATPPLPATLTFIFGYQSGTLMSINLDWYALGSASTAQRQALLDAGSTFMTDQLSYFWAPMQTARGHVLGEGQLMMFTGRDSRGHGVVVQLDGIPLEILKPDGSAMAQSRPTGPAQLHIGLSALPDEPDIMRLNLQENNSDRISGFRSAEFGMQLHEVRAAIAADFGISGDDIQEMENIGEATVILSITVPLLQPGPGPAQVYYILGARSNRLMHVNVLWAAINEPPSEEDRNHIGIAGMQLARYFSEQPWAQNGFVSGQVTRPGEVVLFGGTDSRDAGVEVLVRGIPMSDANGNVTEPDGPALLRLSYSQRLGNPDVIEVRGF